jgi:hypothetical protein
MQAAAVHLVQGRQALSCCCQQPGVALGVREQWHWLQTSN